MLADPPNPDNSQRPPPPRYTTGVSSGVVKLVSFCSWSAQFSVRQPQFSRCLPNGQDILSWATQELNYPLLAAARVHSK